MELEKHRIGRQEHPAPARRREKEEAERKVGVLIQESKQGADLSGEACTWLPPGRAFRK